MRRSILRRVIVVTVTIACLAVLVSGFALLTHNSLAQTATASGPTAGETYTLITGERVIVSALPDGRPTVMLAPSSDGTGSFQVLASGQHLYVLPYYAAGYIGQPLSIDLFDVNAMTPDTSSTTSTQTQLTVEYTSGSGQHLPPGLSKSGNGSVTVTDRKQFGQALAKQWTASAHGQASQLFAGIARIAPKDSAAATTPTGEMFTVTVKAFDRRGQRVEGTLGDTGVVMNADNVDMYLGVQGFFRGNAAFSVPAGHYSISSYITTIHPDYSRDITLAVLPEVNVTHDMTVVLDARKGQRVSATTPRPSTPVYASLNYMRHSQYGVSLTADYTTFDAMPLYATPTAPVSVGEMHFYPNFRLADAQGSLNSYLYDLQFPYAGAIPSDLAKTVTEDQLATIHTRYHSPIPGRAEIEGRLGIGTWVSEPVGAINEVVAPLERTEYVLARPDLQWLQFVAADEQTLTGVAQSNLDIYTPGEQRQTDWMAQPMVPGIQQEPVVGQYCPICRIGDTLSTMLFPFADNHGNIVYENGDPTATESLTLFQNGTQVGQTSIGFGSFAMSPDPANYKLVYDVTKDAAYWPTSTHVHTEWSFSSQERAPDQLPPGWLCGGKGSGGGGGGRAADRGGGGGGGGGDQCSFEPLLFTQYTTSAGLDDVIPGGAQATVDVRVSHQRGAAATPITHVSAQVSYDDGKTWQSVPATDQGNGVFRLQYTQPDIKATNGFAALHIQASDSNGSAIDQTITRAYPLVVTPPSRLPTQGGHGNQPACATAGVAPYVQCMALVNTDAGISLSQPKGLSPADIQAAYNLSPTAGAGRTVAIVDAYDDPQAEADLAFYRAHYGLPACTSASGCFTKVNQRGETTNLPFPDPGWGVEISLDLDAVSAACPACKILLVEADSPSLFDLLTAVQTAQKLGADVISNSYGSRGEISGEQTLERYYRDLSVPFVVSTGDYGYGNGAIPFGGIAYPAASQYAIAVGGTSLTRADTPHGWSESAWDGATSGCSAYIHKPGWQKDNLCSMRTVADVAAVADPRTGLAVYDTFGFDGWLQVGGTSLSAPIISGVYAMAGDGTGVTARTGRYAAGLYNSTGGLFDVTSGANGNQCSGTYLCTAVPGYDGPTGWGTPNGTSAFS